MENLIDHIISGVALFAAIAALVRKARPAHPRGQRKADVVARAVATARKHPSKGVPLEATALEYAILIDMEDGKSDFKREELWAAVRAHLANEPK